MAQGSIQTEEMTQTTSLSAMQVALSHLLELPLDGLKERVNNETEANSALETRGDNEDKDPNINDDYSDDTSNEDNNSEEDTYSTEYEPSPIAEADDYRSEDDTPEYVKKQIETTRDPMEFLAADTASFYEELENQMGDYGLTDHEREVMKYLIGSLDDDGYLHKDLNVLLDELEIYNNVATSLEELEHLLTTLQHFDPRGVGARSLQECLHLQLTDPQLHSPWKDMALKVIDRYFKEFSSNRWDMIAEHLQINEADAEELHHFMKHLNPRPGRAFGESETIVAPTVIPDFYVRSNEFGELEVGLNREQIPELQLSSSYCDSLKVYSNKKRELTREEKNDWLKINKSIEDAKGFINLLQRRNETLLLVMKSIVHLQRPFFEEDDDTLLRPLKLQEIAERANIQISTVSRAVKGKYVQFNHTVYPLKYFFSSAFETKSGQELASRDVKMALKEIIDNEDKKHPYTDKKLVDLLKARQMPVARRTVAKYRDQLGILDSHYRRE